MIIFHEDPKAPQPPPPKNLVVVTPNHPGLTPMGRHVGLWLLPRLNLIPV